MTGTTGIKCQSSTDENCPTSLLEIIKIYLQTLQLQVEAKNKMLRISRGAILHSTAIQCKLSILDVLLPSLKFSRTAHILYTRDPVRWLVTV